MSTILIVEDDMVSREMLVHRLVKCGYQVLQAANGTDAQEMILCCLPDMILLDITLPDINGLDILKRLKSNTKTSAIPVVIVSGRDTSEDVINGLELGACDYITKPYQWGIIIARIRSALRTVEVTRLLKEALYQEKVNVQGKSDFLLNMSHEIRTPLNGILGLLQLMNQTKLTDEQEQYTKLMNTSGDSLMHIVNSLLDLSKAESGLLEVDNKSFNLEELVKNTSEIIYSKACQKGLNVFLKVEEGVKLDVIGDPNRISQILTNYASNALKFTQDGCITFTIKCNEGTEIGSCYRLSVEDTGIGLNAGAQKKLFRKFIQANASISGKYGGTGLGLSICKQIAEVLGGHVGMNSEEGKGTTFWLELPLKYSSSEEIKPQASFENKNILIVGEPFFCTNYSDIVNKWGAVLTTSKELPENIDELDGYDLIITSSEDAMKQLKGRSIKMIVIHEGMISFTFDDEWVHLREPLKPSELRKAIQSTLQQ